MTHDEAQELWLLAIDGALDSTRLRALGDHLNGCVTCREEVERLAAVDRTMRSWGDASIQVSPPAPATPPTRVPEAPRRSFPWPTALAASLLGALLGASGAYFGMRNGDARRAPDVAAAAQDARGQGSAMPRAMETFALMLEEPAASWPPASPLMRPGYFEWRDSLVAQGRYAGGERLAEDEGWYVSSDGSTVPANARTPSAANYSGMFLVRAASYEEAVAIALASPHRQYGGLLVRRVF